MTHSVNSPSRLASKSMLSFDLRRRSSEIGKAVGDELIVERAPGKRRSSGRFTLKAHIEKQLVLAACNNAISKRSQMLLAQATDSAVVPPTEKAKTVKSEKPQIRRTKPKAGTRSVEEPEISLGQNLDSEPELEETGPKPNLHTLVQVSQTQVYISPGKMTPLKLPGSASPLPFMQTPPTVAVHATGVDSSRRELSPIVEEEFLPVDKSELGVTHRKRIKPKGIHLSKFFDIEASESSDGFNGHSGDENESSDDSSDLSDLIASGTVESDDEDAHRKFHMKWEMQQDSNMQQLFTIAEGDDTGSLSRRQRRNKTNQPKLNANCTNEFLKPPKRKPDAKQLPASKNTSSSSSSCGLPPPAYLNRKPTYATRKRRSSVGSSDSEIRISKATCTLRRRASGQFSFIRAPGSDDIVRIQGQEEKKQIMQEKSAAPQRLNGTKRFVFGGQNN